MKRFVLSFDCTIDLSLLVTCLVIKQICDSVNKSSVLLIIEPYFDFSILNTQLTLSKRAQTNSQFILNKPLNDNRFLRVLLNETNIITRNNLFEMLKKNHNCNIELNKNELVIKGDSNMKKDVNTAQWSKCINFELSKYLRLFETKRIAFNNQDEEKILTKKLNAFNELNDNCINYESINAENFMFIAIRREKCDEFESKFDTLDKKKPKEEVKEVLHEFDLPSLNNTKYYSMCSLLCKKIKDKFNLSYLNYDGKRQKICLKCTNNMLNEINTLFLNCLQRIECKRLEEFETSEILRLKDLKMLLESFVDENDLLYRFDVINDNRNTTENGIYVIYFSNCPVIDSMYHVTFEKVKKCILNNATYVDIDVSGYKELLQTQKWTNFRNSVLNNKTNKNFMRYSIWSDKTLLIFGKKDIVFELDYKVRTFLAENKLTSQKLELEQDDVSNFENSFY